MNAKKHFFGFLKKVIFCFFNFFNLSRRHNQVYPEKMGVILILSYGMKLGLKVFQTDKKKESKFIFSKF